MVFVYLSLFAVYCWLAVLRLVIYLYFGLVFTLCLVGLLLICLVAG